MELGGEREGAEEEEHEEHAAVLEVVEVGGVDPAAGEDAEVRGVEHLDAHVGEGAAGDHVELEQPQRRRRGGAGDGVPGADAEGGGRRGEARRRGPGPPQPHEQEQRAGECVALEGTHRGSAGGRCWLVGPPRRRVELPGLADRGLTFGRGRPGERRRCGGGCRGSSEARRC